MPPCETSVARRPVHYLWQGSSLSLIASPRPCWTTERPGGPRHRLWAGPWIQRNAGASSSSTLHHDETMSPWTLGVAGRVVLPAKSHVSMGSGVRGTLSACARGFLISAEKQTELHPQLWYLSIETVHGDLNAGLLSAVRPPLRGVSPAACSRTSTRAGKTHYGDRLWLQPCPSLQIP